MSDIEEPGKQNQGSDVEQATLTINIWTDEGKPLPVEYSDLSDLSQLFVPHLEHVTSMADQGYVAGEIVDEKFSGWWKVENTTPSENGLVSKLISVLQKARAALPDAWLAVRADVPRNLIDEINSVLAEAGIGEFDQRLISPATQKRIEAGREKYLSDNAPLRARFLIARCEQDLKHTLANGQRRDLLMDNTDWTSDEIRDVVALIAAQDAAPDLLVALRNLVDDFDKSVQTTDPMLIEARAAIAKAEGRANA